MRTTVDLEEDVVAALDEHRRAHDQGLSAAVNDLLRRGMLAPRAERRFVQRATAMGSPRLAMDDIGGLLDIVEGDARAG